MKLKELNIDMYLKYFISYQANKTCIYYIS